MAQKNFFLNLNSKLNFSNQVLIHHQNTAIQTRIGNTKDRVKNIDNIFSLHQNIGNLKQKNFILFDDVSTTQSTLVSA